MRRKERTRELEHGKFFSKSSNGGGSALTDYVNFGKYNVQTKPSTRDRGDLENEEHSGKECFAWSTVFLGKGGHFHVAVCSKNPKP